VPWLSDLSDVEEGSGGETLFPLLHATVDVPFAARHSAGAQADGRMQGSERAHPRHAKITYAPPEGEPVTRELRSVFRNLTAARLQQAIDGGKDMYRVADRGSPAVGDEGDRRRDSDAELAWQATNRLCEAQLSEGAEREAERGGSGSVLAVRPRAGSALLFYTRTRENAIDSLVWHGACNLGRGSKYIAQKFKGWQQ